MRYVLVSLLFCVAACGGKKTPPPAVDAAATMEPKAEDAAATKEPKAEDAAATMEPKVEDAAATMEPKAGDAAAAADTGGGAADAALVERGAYIATVTGCAVCHTPLGPQGPVMEKAYGGGLEIPDKIGTWRTPNISQDKKTGIGGWTDAEIIKAVREGVRPDGTRLYPIMPFTRYHVMSDGDAKALVAFLRTLPAIDNAVAGNTDLKMPKPELPPAKGEEPGTDPVSLGRYWANLMHCGDCHTPIGPDGWDMSKEYAGGMAIELPPLGEGTLYSANITPDKETGIGNYTDAEIIKALTEAKKKNGEPLYGPMAFFQPYWSKITDSDLAAIVAFLRSLPPIAHAVPESNFKPHPPPEPPGDAPAADAGAAPPGGDDKADGDASP